MEREAKSQTKVGLNIKVLWRTLAKELPLILPKAVPNLVKNVEVMEGDGGLGTIFLFTFGSDVTLNMTYQKEKIVEFDEINHKFGIQVIEGGLLNRGFSYYATYFHLTGIGETETLVDVTVVSDVEAVETTSVSKTKNSALLLIKTLEDYLLKNN